MELVKESRGGSKGVELGVRNPAPFKGEHSNLHKAGGGGQCLVQPNRYATFVIACFYQQRFGYMVKGWKLFQSRTPDSYDMT